ncbi:hypothetical protein O3G_MSEX006918 [Manduca sexta]|uniref:RNA-directed DNA polymerase n=1 Tax=Manduca sexta TaxID=7130 RepID=A0A921Z466_MANSE|nr:hypothetical protein O3G_MSEX006918 [Manduca sexta]
MLKSSNINLSFYDGSILKPLGYIETEVQYQNVKKKLDLYVFKHGTTNLLGRQWLAELEIAIPKFNIYSISKERCNKINIINNIISRHKSLFDGTLGRYSGGPVQLCVRPGAQPVFSRARPVPYAMRTRVDAELDAMLRAGVIEPVERSDWASPLVIARKSDGGIRLCADYKVTLNPVLMIDRYPVPRIDDLLSDLSGNMWFTKLDLSQAYNQLELDARSRDYTVINTHRGLFKYKRLVYGLSSSPGIFQRIMINLFKNEPDVLIFYDDILIKSKDLESHLRTIDKVFEILGVNGLKIKRSKCDFLSNEIQYLGFIIGWDGVKVNSEKIKPIISMPHPNNVTELKSFLGMVNYYGKFVKNMSTFLSPLYDLLKKGQQFKWGSKHNVAFKQIKKLLCSTDVLAHYDMSLETILTCDASAHGLGAVLAQRTRDNHEQVVAYASRVLTPAEKHYSQIHKEALAIIFAVDKFNQYLYGRKFTLRTDHKPLVSIFSPNTSIPCTAASRLQRWAIKLSAYDFNIEYVKTDQNTADVLSRLIKTHKEEAVNEDELPEQTYLHFATEALLLDYKLIKKETLSDPVLSRIMSFIQDGWPNNVDIKEFKPYFNRKNELYVELGCILWGHRLVIPFACRNRVLKELHDSHMGLVKTKALARSYVWWPGIDEAIETECRSCTICVAVADAPPQQTAHSWPWPSRPWSRLHIDFLGPIAGLTYLVVVDSCSKWIEAINMKSTTSQAVIVVLRDIWSRFGIPRQLVSDNGTSFSSEEFKTFLKKNGVEQIFSAPYHPASNGAAENAVKICKRVIKKALKQNLNVDVALCRFLLTYRNTEHYTTGESPAKILQGRNLRMRLDALKPDRMALVQKRQARSEEAAGGAHRQFATGEKVWFRDYRGPDKWVAGQVIRELGNSDYSVRSSLGTEVHRHVDQLKQRYELLDKTDNAYKQSRSSLTFPLLPTKGNDNQNKTSQLLGSPKATAEFDSCKKSAECTEQTQILRDDATPVPVPQAPDIQIHNEVSVSERRYPLRNRKPVQRYGIEQLD